MAGLELPQLGESLEKPIEDANGAVLRGGHMDDAVDVSVGARLWYTLWNPMWNAIARRTGALRTALDEAL